MKSPPPFSRLPFFAKQKKKNVCEGEGGRGQGRQGENKRGLTRRGIERGRVVVGHPARREAVVSPVRLMAVRMSLLLPLKVFLLFRQVVVVVVDDDRGLFGQRSGLGPEHRAETPEGQK